MTSGTPPHSACSESLSLLLSYRCYIVVILSSLSLLLSLSLSLLLSSCCYIVVILLSLSLLLLLSLSLLLLYRCQSIHFFRDEWNPWLPLSGLGAPELILILILLIYLYYTSNFVDSAAMG